MPSQALPALTLVTLALLAYSTGVWAERATGRLKGWHLIFFWLGLGFDAAGTGLMMGRAGGLTFDVRGATGLLAILLMAIHALWAAVVLLRKDERAAAAFHRFSMLVWAIWLIPWANGILFSM